MPQWDKYSEDPDWHTQAACKDMDSGLFFIEGRDSRLVLQAKMVCITCPVRLNCLQIGLNEYQGIFGGTSNIDRSRIKRSLRRGFTIREELEKLDKRTIERWERLQEKEADDK